VVGQFVGKEALAAVQVAQDDGRAAGTILTVLIFP
jgi:hypothetical protein